MAKAMSEREYAAWRRAKKLPGATRKSVQAALKSGRISKNAEGLIEPDISTLLESAYADWDFQRPAVARFSFSIKPNRAR